MSTSVYEKKAKRILMRIAFFVLSAIGVLTKEEEWNKIALTIMLAGNQQKNYGIKLVRALYGAAL